MPFGLVPQRSTLVPSPFFCSHESSVQVPTRWSFNGCCWPSALNVTMNNPKVAMANPAKITRKFIDLSVGEDWYQSVEAPQSRSCETSKTRKGMSAAGRSRRLDGISATSGLPPWRDIGWTDRQVRKVPQTDSIARLKTAPPPQCVCRKL